jgi:hypothetical protein
MIEALIEDLSHVRGRQAALSRGYPRRRNILPKRRFGAVFDRQSYL